MSAAALGLCSVGRWSTTYPFCHNVRLVTECGYDADTRWRDLRPCNTTSAECMWPLGFCACSDIRLISGLQNSRRGTTTLDEPHEARPL